MAISGRNLARNFEVVNPTDCESTEGRRMNLITSEQDAAGMFSRGNGKIPNARFRLTLGYVFGIVCVCLCSFLQARKYSAL